MEKLSKAPLAFIIRTYLMLAKPGIIMGNALTAGAGFALASRGHFDFWLFLATLEGLSLVIGSACVFNNYIDREVDKKMARTKNRALAVGLISPQSALIYGAFLGLLGTYILIAFTNLLTVAVALFGVLIYVAVYSFLKYHTIHGTLIGSLAGAVPPVVGYCAVTSHFDAAALTFFVMIALWQMPHFYAIAIYRLDDYAKACIPMYPTKKGISITKVHMLLYIAAFAAASCMLTFLGYTGYTYLTVMVLLSAAWLVLCIKGFKCGNDQRWARQMFIFSLIIVTALSAVIPFSVL